MKKITISVVMIMFLMVNTCFCASRTYNNNDDMVYAVKRNIFWRHPKISTDKDIIFTKIFTRNKLTHETKFLFEAREEIKDIKIVNDNVFALTNAGIYKSDISRENLQLILGGNISSFAVNADNIFYCLYNADIEHFQIMRCDLYGNNKVVLAQRVLADKLTVINRNIIYSESSSVGRISGNHDVDTYMTNFSVPMPGGGRRQSLCH